MESFFKYLITPLLSQPDSLEITLTDNNLTFKVADPDVGRVIGKHGHVIQSLRVLLKTYCSIHNLPPANLTLLSPIKKG